MKWVFINKWKIEELNSRCQHCTINCTCTSLIIPKRYFEEETNVILIGTMNVNTDVPKTKS